MALSRNDQPIGHSTQRPRMGPALVGMTLSLLVLGVVCAWAEARWPNPAGAWITVTAPGNMNPVDSVRRLRLVEGVQDALAVLARDAPLDEMEEIPWSGIALYAVQSAGVDTVPPIPLFKMAQGRLPAPLSLDEVALSYEVARVLRRHVGDVLPIVGRRLQVVGIGIPSARWPGNWLQVSASAAERVSPASGLRVDHYAVKPDGTRSPAEVAARIWQTMPEMGILSPGSELSVARQERAVLLIAVCSAAVLALLVSLPLIGDLGPAGSRTVLPVALAAGAGALAFG
jgi:hypothetical protein